MSNGAVSAASRWRRAAVAPLLRSYASDPAVDAVVVSGSTARGHADRWSDVEMGVFWSTTPSDDRRRDLAASAQNCRLFPYDESERCWADDLELEPDGLLTEVVHMLTADAETFVNDVTQRFDPDPGKRNVVAGILDGQPASGEVLIGRWQRQATPYPRELALAVVNAFGMIDHFQRWRVLYERDNPMQLARQFSSAARQMIEVLMAVNGQYGPKPEKWLARAIAGMQTAPPDLFPRLHSVFTDPAAPQAAATLTTLIEQTYDIVAECLPEVDVQRLRQVFRHQRPPIDHTI